jgi:hypothetical protein
MLSSSRWTRWGSSSSRRLLLGICWDDRLKRTLSFCRPAPTREQIWAREVAFKRGGQGIRCVGETPQKQMKRLTPASRHEAQLLYRKQLVYYTMCYTLTWYSWYHSIVQFSPALCSKKKKKPLNKTPHNPEPSPRPADAFACHSFPKRLITLLNTLIIPPYMILRSL